MEYAQFTSDIEVCLRVAVRDCFPRTWDEDHITLSLTERLQKQFRRVEIDDLDRHYHVSWDAYKMTGQAEQRFGDLGVLVSMQTWGGETLEGVGLLEAKRRDRNSSRFKAMKPSQLRRLHNKTRNSQLLLYDYDQISGFEDNLHAAHCWARLGAPIWRVHPNFLSSTPYSHAVVLPIGTALELKPITTDLYKFSLPFSHQLCGRYLRGFDLETEPDIIEAVKGVSDEWGGPSYLWVLSVSTGLEPPPVQLNPEVYRPID